MPTTGQRLPAIRHGIVLTIPHRNRSRAMMARYCGQVGKANHDTMKYTYGLGRGAARDNPDNRGLRRTARRESRRWVESDARARPGGGGQRTGRCPNEPEAEVAPSAHRRSLAASRIRQAVCLDGAADPGLPHSLASHNPHLLAHLRSPRAGDLRRRGNLAAELLGVLEILSGTR